ncbi:hypothetical protein [Corynebacterium sp. sy039]|uniref:hypothetical protein n=1 Tax=Corynebacterium sp. sy039 TaxID=2599641 RepID=UPI00352DF2C0
MFRKKSRDEDIIDFESSDPQKLLDESGAAGKALVYVIEKAAGAQKGIVVKYIDWLRKQNPHATPAELQKKLDKHFINISTSTGAGAGATAAIPGVGFFLGALAVGAESLAFLDAATMYVLASAYLRGADITKPERRQALVLIAVTGSAGTALIDASIGAGSPVAMLSRLSVRNMGDVNNRLIKLALKRINRSVKAAWLGKIMPLGIGAVIGLFANRKIATKVTERVRSSLGPLPATFAQAEQAAAKNEAIAQATESAETEQQSSK